MLTDHLGTDLAKISNELGKLLLSLPEGTKKITDAHIEQNIGISKDFNNFELCKAVTGQNLEQALRIADHFARNPKDNPLLVTILALFNQFREIFRINYLRWLSRHKGVPFPPCGASAPGYRCAAGCVPLLEEDFEKQLAEQFPVRGAARVHALRFGVVFAQQPQDAEHSAVVPPCRGLLQFAQAAPSGSTATRNCWLAIYKSFSGCAGPPTFADWRHRSPLCSTPTVTPSQALRSYAWPSHRRATCC